MAAASRVELPSLELDEDEFSNSTESLDRSALRASQAWNLYISHGFSTWNSRGYEFATILFTAAAYPGILSAAALRMIIVYFAMVIFSGNVGSWVDNSPNRLRTLITTILINRGVICLASFVWLAILSQESLVAKSDALKHVLFGTAICLGIIERLSASGNLISMERDWVVTAANTPGRQFDLTHLNVVMRRIDLVCKLVSPIVISVVISSQKSTAVGVIYTRLTSFISVPIELVSAWSTWKRNKALQMPKLIPNRRDPDTAVYGRSCSTWSVKISEFLTRFTFYFSTTVWVPSLSLAMLHFNMLTWRSTFITWLINAGYSLNFITLARTVGSILEIGSTVLTPLGVRYFGTVSRYTMLPNDHDNEEDVSFVEDQDHEEEEGVDGSQKDQRTLLGLQRTGLWGLTVQFLNLLPVLIALWIISYQIQDGRGFRVSEGGKGQEQRTGPNMWLSVIMFGFLSLSRLGVWVFDLTTQQLTQTMVDEASTFAGVENSIVNIFELAGAVAAIGFPRTDQFKWLALASYLLAMVSWGMYVGWERGRRGQLVH